MRDFKSQISDFRFQDVRIGISNHLFARSPVPKICVVDENSDRLLHGGRSFDTIGGGGEGMTNG